MHTYEKDSPEEVFFLFIAVDFHDRTGNEVEGREKTKRKPFLLLFLCRVMFSREIACFWIPTSRNCRVAVRVMALNEQNIFQATRTIVEPRWKFLSYLNLGLNQLRNFDWMKFNHQNVVIKRELFPRESENEKWRW